jgi:hypothetical protein
MFNKDFFTSNTKYTREIAEARLIELGYSNFTFKNSCYTNGASFYFTSSEGKEIRVSDHSLTGKRAFTTIQVDIVEKKNISIAKIQKENKEIKVEQSFSIGDVVENHLGQGIVLGLENNMISIDFKNSGVKNIIIAFANLKKVC